jgi:uncharacterized protein
LDPVDARIASVILKVASRCNLNCAYCYVYNKADRTWQSRPALMSDAIFEATLQRIRRHCILTRQGHIHLHFHGGEPCLIGAKQFDVWCTRAKQILEGVATVDLGIQTNATLIDACWTDAFLKHQVDVGISLDGAQPVHDMFRVDHAGRGSYERVARGLRLVQEAQVPYHILSVVQLGADSVAIHRHILSLGCKSIVYILPDFTHDTIGPVRARYGPTPCADFLLPVFDDWWFNGTMDVMVKDLWNVARIVLGGVSAIETFGNVPPSYLFVETDGEIEGLDCLRSCEEGISKINLNVLDADFEAILQKDTMHRVAIFEGVPLSASCQRCPESETCAGGYLPHRYSASRGFDNPSVWCADLLKLFSHVRRRLRVPLAETHARRRALRPNSPPGGSSRLSRARAAW